MMNGNENNISSANQQGMIRYSSSPIKKGLMLADILQREKQKLPSIQEKSDKRLQEFYDKAIADYKLGNYKKSIVFFDQLLRENPDHFSAFYFRGSAYNKLEDEERSYEDFRAAVSIGKSSNNRSILFSDAQATVKYLEGDISSFVEILETSPEGNSFSSAFDIFLQGTIYGTSDNKLLAIEKFTEALKIEKNVVPFLLARSYCYCMLGYQENNVDFLIKALDDADKALSINPEHDQNATNYFIRGCTFYYLKAKNQALADIDMALKINPNHTNSLNIKGLIYQEEGKIQQAIDLFTKVIALEPNNSEAYINRFQARLAIGDIKGSAEDFAKSITSSFSGLS